MDKKTINEEQFKKLVIKEAKKIFSENEKVTPIVENNKVDKSAKTNKLSIDEVESLIKEMEEMNTSITSLSSSVLGESKETAEEIVEGSNKPDRGLDVIKHNKGKNVIHVDEKEKDKWSRMMNYEVPKDEDRK